MPFATANPRPSPHCASNAARPFWASASRWRRRAKRLRRRRTRRAPAPRSRRRERAPGLDLNPLLQSATRRAAAERGVHAAAPHNVPHGCAGLEPTLVAWLEQPVNREDRRRSTTTSPTAAPARSRCAASKPGSAHSSARPRAVAAAHRRADHRRARRRRPGQSRRRRRGRRADAGAEHARDLLGESTGPARRRPAGCSRGGGRGSCDVAERGRRPQRTGHARAGAAGRCPADLHVGTCARRGGQPVCPRRAARGPAAQRTLQRRRRPSLLGSAPGPGSRGPHAVGVDRRRPGRRALSHPRPRAGLDRTAPGTAVRRPATGRHRRAQRVRRSRRQPQRLAAIGLFATVAVTVALVTFLLASTPPQSAASRPDPGLPAGRAGTVAGARSDEPISEPSRAPRSTARAGR